MNDLTIGKELYHTTNGTNVFCEGEYKGDPVFVLIYRPFRTKFREEEMYVFDRNTRVYKAIMSRIEKCGALTRDTKENGHSLLKFRRLSDKDGSISFRCFLWAKYRKCGLKNARKKKVLLVDDSDTKNGINDFRSCNLYAPGELREITSSRSIKVVNRPGRPDERYINIEIHNRENGKTEVVPYTKELYEMLANPGTCNLGYNANNDRATVVVHFAHRKDGYVLSNLSQFVAIYKEHFDGYRNRRGAVKRFIADYDKLRKRYTTSDNPDDPDNKDAGHINAVKWNNAFENILFMSHDTNNKMRDIIKLFDGEYRIYTAVNERKEILIEFQVDGCNSTYYKASTPEAFLGWQKLMLGKYGLTKHLTQKTIVGDNGSVCSALTPGGMVASGMVSGSTAKNNEVDFWEWCDHRDKLLDMPDEVFVQCPDPSTIEHGVSLANFPLVLKNVLGFVGY